jgi:hypothetical protein
VKLEPSSKEARDKYDQCKSAVTRARFEAAISVDHDRKPLSETIDLESMGTQHLKNLATPRSLSHLASK